MRGAMLYGPYDVRSEERGDPTIIEPTDAIIRISAACVCGSDLWPYRGIQPITEPIPMGHEYAGIVEEVGSEVTRIKPGHVAVVTGTGSGMGLATAQAFAEAGASVVLAGINEETLRTAADGLTAVGHQALGVTCDVSDENQVAALVERAVATFGRLDMAFNNAGIQVPPSDAVDEPGETPSTG